MFALKGILGEYLLNDGKFRQIGTVVKNLDAAVEMCKKFWGEDIKLNYFMAEPQPFSQLTYKGKPTQARCKICTFKIAETEWELIEPDDSPSSWRDGLIERGGGLHHLGYMVNNLDKVKEILQNHGINIIQEGRYPKGRYIYADASILLGTILELGEAVDEVEKEYLKLKEQNSEN